MGPIRDEEQRRKNAVRVMVRVRPLLPQEFAHPACVDTREHGVIEVMKGNSKFKSQYQTVISEDVGQEAMYDKLRTAVNDAFDGYNATVLAYGQTGTGKTHTMMGSHDIRSSEELGKLSEQHGIIPRAIHEIFSRSAGEPSRKSTASITIICSYMEINNDRLYDLLQPYKKHLANRDIQVLHEGVVASIHNWHEAGSILDIKPRADMRQQKADLTVKEDGFGQIYVQHLMAVKVTDLDQVFRLIKKGNDQRSMRQTELNQNSSRGHSILQFLLEQRPHGTNNNTVTRSKINFVDLAGSERYPADNSSKSRVTEMNAINVSLSSLASVVSALVAKEKHVPYRDSKLTHLLKDSLGGNCNTYIIATISPSECSFDENVSTLKFADRASAISNNAVKNVQLDLKNLLEMKDREIDRLRAMVMAFAEKQDDDGSDVSRTASRISTSENQVRSLKGQIEQLQEALDLERRRAQELESQMRGVTVVDAPDLLDVDSFRRDASLNSAVGTSTGLSLYGGAPAQMGGRRMSGRFRRPAPPLADDLSMFALGPPPAYPTPHVRDKDRRQEAKVSRDDKPVVLFPGSTNPYAPSASGQKRRPKGRPRNQNPGDGQIPLSMLGPMNPAAVSPPTFGVGAKGTAKSDLQSSQNRTYQHLLDMYSKLASDVAGLNIDLAPGAAKRRKNQPADSSSDLPLRQASPAKMNWGIQAQAKVHDEGRGQWGLRNILVSRGATSEPAVPSLLPPMPSANMPPSSTGGFGLRSILLNAKASAEPAPKDDRRIMSSRDVNVKPSKAGMKNPDIFDAGSWIYIMGTSASSVKAKQIAASTKRDPRMANLALKSIDLVDIKHRR